MSIRWRLITAFVLFTCATAAALGLSGPGSKPLPVARAQASKCPYPNQFSFGAGPPFRTSGSGIGFFVVATLNAVEDVDSVQGIVEWRYDEVSPVASSDPYGSPYPGGFPNLIKGFLTLTVHWVGGGVGTFTSTCNTEVEVEGSHDPTGNGWVTCAPSPNTICELNAEGEFEGFWVGDFPDHLDGNGEPVFVTFAQGQRTALVNFGLSKEGNGITFDTTANFSVEFGLTCNEVANPLNSDDGFERISLSTEGDWTTNAVIPDSGTALSGAFATPPGGCPPGQFPAVAGAAVGERPLTPASHPAQTPRPRRPAPLSPRHEP